MTTAGPDAGLASAAPLPTQFDIDDNTPADSGAAIDTEIQLDYLLGWRLYLLTFACVHFCNHLLCH